MDFQVMEKEIAVCETLVDTFSEQPVDCDFVLPDYCPDIAAVLKCSLDPRIQTRQQSTDRLLADGTALVRVLYLDEERKCVRCCEFSQPFSATFQLPAIPPGASIILSAKTDYVNCRAVSPRRLDIHGAFTVKLTVTAEGSNQVVADILGDGVFTRKRAVVFSVPAASTEKVFTVSEVLELGSGQPAEMLVRSEVVPTVTDFKVLANKAILKGMLLIRALYVTDSLNGHTETTIQELPFSQIIDVEGLSEDWTCEVELSSLADDLQVSSSQNGENGLLSVSTKLLAMVRCYRTGQAEVVTDAYSARCPLSMNAKRLSVSQLLGIRRDTQTVRETFDLPSETMKDVVDVWCETGPAAVRIEGNRSLLDSRLLVCMLVRDAGGEISYYERADNFTLEYDEACTDMHATLQPCRVEYSVTPSKQMEIRVEMAVTRRCYLTEEGDAVYEAMADESAVFPAEKAALKIYYADRGESLWEIAKSCHTSMQAVMEENHLDADVLSEDAMLLVPLC